MGIISKKDFKAVSEELEHYKRKTEEYVNIIFKLAEENEKLKLGDKK